MLADHYHIICELISLELRLTPPDDSIGEGANSLSSKLWDMCINCDARA